MRTFEDASQLKFIYQIGASPYLLLVLRSFVSRRGESGQHHMLSQFWEAGPRQRPDDADVLLLQSLSREKLARSSVL